MGNEKKNANSQMAKDSGLVSRIAGRCSEKKEHNQKEEESEAALDPNKYPELEFGRYFKKLRF